jgi:hypothetical protein
LELVRIGIGASLFYLAQNDYIKTLW